MSANGQNYQAINGSSYAGSLGQSFNPAVILDAPYSWDITPLALQVKQSTNALILNNYSLLSSPQKATVDVQYGNASRFLYANQDIRLLNSRIRLNSKSAIAFGANLHNYVYAVTSKSNWQGSFNSVRDFMNINTGNIPLSLSAAGNSWAEVYGTYSQTLFDDGQSRLQAGITLKLNRPLAGAYLYGNGISFSPETSNNGKSYILTAENLQYGYSGNLDNINGNNSFTSNRKAFLQNGYTGIGIDLGFEYLFISPGDEREAGNKSYNTKIGLSLMDLGSNKYRYGAGSRFSSGFQNGITDSVINSKFSNISTIDRFNDSLGSIANSLSVLQGNFHIFQPTRLVINIDKYIAQNFFVNSEITIPVISLVSGNTIQVKNLNLLAITPRWETRNFGAYLPVLLNTINQLWVGAAIKAGPVLLGLHNLGNLFSKDKTQSGGFYVAFTIRPGKDDGRLGDNGDKLSKKQMKMLDCPKL